MNKLIGSKTRLLFEKFISKNLPDNMEDFIYVEPFGGTFSVGNKLTSKPKMKVYNDIQIYDFNIVADIIEHRDFEEIINEYDSVDTFFYLDPPYFKKEYYYDMEHDVEFHNRIFDVLKNIKGKFLLSYQNHPYIINLYKSYNIKYNDNDTNMFRSKEILISNY